MTEFAVAVTMPNYAYFDAHSKLSKRYQATNQAPTQAATYSQHLHGEELSTSIPILK